jgi:hypothetical protein
VGGERRQYRRAAYPRGELPPGNAWLNHFPCLLVLFEVKFG